MRERAEQLDYRAKEIMALLAGSIDGEPLALQVRGGYPGSKTKWLNLNATELRAVNSALNPSLEQFVAIGTDNDDSVQVDIGNDLQVTVMRSALEMDRGQPVVVIDGSGPVRVSVNEGVIWDADPDSHTHALCACTALSERKQ